MGFRGLLVDDLPLLQLSDEHHLLSVAFMYKEEHCITTYWLMYACKTVCTSSITSKVHSDSPLPLIKSPAASTIWGRGVIGGAVETAELLTLKVTMVLAAVGIYGTFGNTCQPLGCQVPFNKKGQG